MRAIVLLLVAVGSSATPASGQAPPVFRAGVDVVAVDASVVDAEGRPVLGLGPTDFRVEVDGKPRAILSVEYVGRDLEPPAAVASPPAHFSTNENTPMGRLVLLIVDRGNIGRGAGRTVLKSADRFLGTLAPADRVGLVFVPGPGSGIEFTADVEEVRRGLGRAVGTADRAGHKVPLAEAVAKIQLNDRMRWEQFLTLQCGGALPQGAMIAPSSADETVPFALLKLQGCQREFEADALRVYQEYLERSLATQAALRATFESLQRIEGPKTVVLISEGLGTESPAEVRDLALAASAAHVTLFVVLLDTSSADASVQYSAVATHESRELEAGGLHDLAGQARGAVLRAVGSGDHAFERISRELMGYYLLGFEPEAGDRDGRGHAVKVAVSRQRVTVRARGLLTIPTAPPPPLQLLAAGLRSPLVDRGLPIRASSFALPGAEPGKVRVLVAAQVGRASRPASVGFALSRPDGKVVASRAYEGVQGGEGDWLEFTTEATVDPANYTLRLAVVDASGRHASVEHTVKAALVDAGGLQVSDLVLAPAAGGAAVRPAVDTEISGGGLSAFVEIGSKLAERLGQAGVSIELADSAEAPALLAVPVELRPAEHGTRAAQIDVAAGLLPPGDYTARARVSVQGQAVAVVSRPFRIVPLRAGERPPSAPLARLLVEAPTFDRAELLRPEVLGPLVDVVRAAARGPAPAGVDAAVAEARRGRPEAMLDQLGASGKEDARVAFLRGVSYYARGNLQAALTQLQTALRVSSDLFPAAVYIGACYAAAGKDVDAIGAWQTALIGEGAGPTLYALLSDALVRAKQEKEAVDILGEGLAAFPGDAALRARLGVAHAMAGDREQALPILTSWVEAHPEDTRALFATLALLFEGFSRQAAGAAPAEERQRLLRFARTYANGKGPNREVVARWLRYLESREGGRPPG